MGMGAQHKQVQVGGGRGSTVSFYRLITDAGSGDP